MIAQWHERGIDGFDVAELLGMDVDATLSPENPSARKFANDAYLRLAEARGPVFVKGKMTKKRYDRLTAQMQKFYFVFHPERSNETKG